MTAREEAEELMAAVWRAQADAEMRQLLTLATCGSPLLLAAILAGFLDALAVAALSLPQRDDMARLFEEAAALVARPAPGEMN